MVDPHGGAAGEVVLSVMATEVAATLFGGRSWGPEAISVGVHSVTLEDDLQASPLTSISTVWVEVDLLSDRNPEAAPMKSEVIKREAFETTPSLRLEGAGAMPLSSRWDVSLAEGTPRSPPSATRSHRRTSRTRTFTSSFTAPTPSAARRASSARRTSTSSGC